MKKKILINAIYPEEKRVAIVEGDVLVDFYVEAAGKEHLRGNIYKGVVVRIEPGLQAAFVDFGLKKHGFLQMREVNPEYFNKKPEGKRTRIQDVLLKGQELIVQVEKDERDTKGASLTTYISLPGRYIVMMPGQERVGISRKIENREDRERLKEMFSELKLPKKTGFILRTACSDRTGEELSNDLKYLTKLWSKIQTESKKVSAPALIYREHDISVRTVRDYLTSDVSEVLIDDETAFKATKAFLRKTLPWRKINIKYYKEKRPVFVKHSIEEQIAKLHDRYVHLPSKGYIVIDKTEALTAIDVNSGRSRKEENVESTALRTNIEAADEISRQLRLRDIGGLIVMDFIDMVSSKNRREVENRLRTALSSDKAHTEITGISKFGIIEMTRERMRTAYIESVNRKCEVCDGTGIVKTAEMVALSASRDIYARASQGGLKNITCRLPVESANYLINARRDEIAAVEKEFGVKVRILAEAKLVGRYDITVESVEQKAEPAQEKKQEQRPEAKGEVKDQGRHKRKSEFRRKPRHKAVQEEKPEEASQQAPEPSPKPAIEPVLESRAEAVQESGTELKPQPGQEPSLEPAREASQEQPRKSRRKQGWRQRRRSRPKPAPEAKPEHEETEGETREGPPAET
jgi:ribonuclease E